MSDQMPVALLSIEDVRAELRVWQARGLAGIARTDAERNRVATLWRRIDDECRRELRKTKAAAMPTTTHDPPPVYRCEVCGGYAGFGYGVFRDKPGRWFCGEHRQVMSCPQRKSTSPHGASSH
jgi:hypothetical protein